jgi:hypothetical protein
MSPRQTLVQLELDVGLLEIAAKRCGMTLADVGWMIGDHPVADALRGRWRLAA